MIKSEKNHLGKDRTWTCVAAAHSRVASSLYSCATVARGSEGMAGQRRPTGATRPQALRPLLWEGCGGLAGDSSGWQLELSCVHQNHSQVNHMAVMQRRQRAERGGAGREASADKGRRGGQKQERKKGGWERQLRAVTISPPLL